MHTKTKGEFLVYMDDDDYYPPERVEHAVDVLQKNPRALCAGSSELYVYFKHIDQMYQSGPFGPTPFHCRNICISTFVIAIYTI